MKLGIGVLALLSALLASGQDTGSIRGRIIDPRADALDGVKIEVSRGDLYLSAVTDDRGAFRIERLDPGDYNFSASHPGFNIRRIGSIRVVSGESKLLPDLPLQVASSCFARLLPDSQRSSDAVRSEIVVHLSRLPYPDHDPVAARDVEVQITSTTGQNYRGKTDSQGIFSVVAVEPGDYRVQPGYGLEYRLFAGLRTGVEIELPWEECPERGCDEKHPRKPPVLEICE